MFLMQRSRGWCFTLNNWTHDEVLKIKENLAECRYWIMGREVAPDTSTPHVQGYLYCKNAVSFNTVRLWLLGRAHVEKAKATPAQNYEYCSKDKDFEEYGSRPMSQEEKGEVGGDAQKEKWSTIWNLAKQGNIDEIAEQFPKECFVHYRNLLLIRQSGSGSSGDLDNVCGLWLYGESGAGKSHKSRHMDTVENTYIKGINKWWCNYHGQRTVILEDVGKDHGFLGDFLKIWADKWAFTAEFKGGTMARARPTRFIVTSQYRIDDIWQDKETRDALHRRFEEQEVVKGPLDVLIRSLPDPVAVFPGVGAQEVTVSPIAYDVVPSDDDMALSLSPIDSEEMSDYEKRKRKRVKCPFIEDECGESD
ncbi:replication-associated protein [Crucivirus-251]|nr:replication-associated protein [Crucivirus-251]